jgi:hypothetical protein
MSRGNAGENPSQLPLIDESDGNIPIRQHSQPVHQGKQVALHVLIDRHRHVLVQHGQGQVDRAE